MSNPSFLWTRTDQRTEGTILEMIHKQLSIQNCYYVVHILKYLGTESETAVSCIIKRESRKAISSTFQFHYLVAFSTKMDMKEKFTFVCSLDKRGLHHVAHVEVSFTIHTKPEHYHVSVMIRPLRERSLLGRVMASNLRNAFHVS